MSYCVNCGIKLAENARFCQVCGTPVAGFVREEFKVSSENLIEKVKELLHEGNVTRVIVKDDQGRTLLDMPATAGIFGLLLAPWLAALGVIAALATNCTVVVEKRKEES